MALDDLHAKDFDGNATGPLDGLMVVDLSRLVCGNMLTLQLADFGAEVIKIEPLVKGDPLRTWSDAGVQTQWKVYGRNKKSLAVELRSAAGIEAVRKLTETADVFVEGFRPGTLEKMGLAPEDLLAANPKLVIARISGFGQTGPYREKPGFGSLIEGMSGFADRNGFPDREPVLPPLAMADMVAGLQGAFAVMVALKHAEAGGQGQVIDLALLEPLYSILGPEALVYQVTGESRKRRGSGSNTSAPRNVYKTKDGKYVSISASIQSMAERLFRVIGRADLITDPRYATNEERVKRRPEMDAIVGGWIGERDQSEVMEIFGREAVTCAPVYDQADILDDPHVIEREVVVTLPDDELGTIPMHNIGPRLGATPGAIRTPAPKLGQHSREILGRLGYGSADIDQLIEEGVVQE